MPFFNEIYLSLIVHALINNFLFSCSKFGISGGGGGRDATARSINRDPISDQKRSFKHAFSHLALCLSVAIDGALLGKFLCLKTNSYM